MRTRQFYVAPNGNDEWSGQCPDPSGADGPFATLDRARDAVRAARSADPGDSHEIVLRGGVYNVRKTLVLKGTDGNTPDRPVVWRAAEGEAPVLRGSVPVKGWQRLRNEPSHLHPDARDRVWVAELPEGIESTFSLYHDDKRLSRARCEGFARNKQPELQGHQTHSVFAFPEGRLRNWPDMAHAEIVVIPSWTWTMNILPLANVDETAGIAETLLPCTYPLAPNHRQVNTWVENTLAVLREPGMWVCNPTERLIYYWPEADEPGENISAGNLTELIRIEGEIHASAGADHPALGIEFRGITFTHGERHSWHGLTGNGLQHDWDMHDSPTALVRLRGASRCSFAECVFRDSACAGLRMDLTANRNTVSGCTFFHLGGTGITVAGYGLGTKNTSRANEIVGCHVHHIGEVYWHSPAIFIWQSEGNRVADCLVHNTPYSGIVCSGRTCMDRKGVGECSRTIRWSEVDAVLGPEYSRGPWHSPDCWRDDWLKREPLMHSRNNVIECNKISHVMEIMGDGNGVYVSGAGGGNTVHGNVIHDCPSPTFGQGVRCDDDQHDTVIENNLMYYLGGMGMGVSIKGINIVRNNIIAAPLAGTDRGLISLEVGPLHGAVITRNILYTLREEDPFFYQDRLGCHGEGPQPLLRDCLAEGNLYWCRDSVDAGEKHLAAERAHGVEATSMCADPCFTDPENGDFTLKPESPAFNLGIKAIPYKE